MRKDPWHRIAVGEWTSAGKKPSEGGPQRKERGRWTSEPLVHAAQKCERGEEVRFSTERAQKWKGMPLQQEEAQEDEDAGSSSGRSSRREGSESRDEI